MVKKVQWRKGSKGGEVVRVLASHQYGPSSNPGVDAIYGLSFLLFLSFAPRGFSPGTTVFPSPQKPTCPNSNSTRNHPFQMKVTGTPPPTPLKMCTQHNNKMYSLLFLFRWRWCHINGSTDITRCYWDADWAHTGWLWVVRHSQVTTCWKAI